MSDAVIVCLCFMPLVAALIAVQVSAHNDERDYQESRRKP